MLRMFFVTLVFVVSGVISAQTENRSPLPKLITEIDVAVSGYSAAALLGIDSTLQKIFAADSSNNTVLYYLAYTEYNLVAMSLNDDALDLFDRFYTPAEKHAAAVAEVRGFSSEGKTLLAAIYMMKIAHSWTEAMSLSKPFYMLLAEAEQINPDNPRTFYIKGMMKLKTPSMFGGSREEALKLFTKANALFEAERTSKTDGPRWGYIACLTWSGQAYAEDENLETAKFYYKKALEVNPEYGWVKYKLLPDLEKKMNKE
ncbi:MAG: tetratricopeptide repeat protein [Ignavibacteriales bacterium]|nr:tetratricopeptide repeat protein [Ignavibacteriales bacterium]